MTSLFSMRKRAEEFAAAVDGRSRVASEEMQTLVGVATSLRSHTDTHLDAMPRAEFAADLRARLMVEAETVLTPGASLVLPQRRRGARERRLVAAASAVVLLGGTASMAAAAQNALPGEALYPIKRGLEQAEAGLSVSPAGKGRDLLHQANDRLDEVEGLLTGDSLATARVPATLEDFTSQAQEGADLLMTSFQETRDPHTIEAVREFAANGIVLLQDLARTAPAPAQDELTEAALLLSAIDEQASALCSSCAAGLPDLEVPEIFLAAAEVSRAMEYISAATLDNSHPVVVDKRAIKEPESPLKTTAPDSDGGYGTPEAPETPTAPDGSPDADVDLIDDKQVAKTNKEIDETVEDTVEGTIDGLTGLAGTLLPDPS